MTEYTLLEAARELGFTKNAVKYRVQKLPPDVLRKSEDGIIHITSAGIELLREQMGKKAQPGKETTSTTQEPDKNQQTTEQEPLKEPIEPDGNHTTTGQEQPNKNHKNDGDLIALLKQQAAALMEQLAVKDEQIASQARQIETLVESLKLAQQTAAAAQALHAGTIQKELNAAQTDPEPPQDTHQEDNSVESDKSTGGISFFQRLKRRFFSA